MSKKTIFVYCIAIAGKLYHVKLGHVEEFIDLHRSHLETDAVIVYGVAYDTAEDYDHPYQWYRKV